MATIYTHAVVGLGIARVCTTRRMPWLFWALAVFLPIMPDLDVFSTAAYGSMLGHRGLSHSLLVGFWISCLAASLTYRYCRTSFWLLSVLFFALVASHGLLDALTRGGESIPFFWPLAQRFGNWGPIPVADVSFELPDPRRSRALRSEILWAWLPTAIVVITVMAWRWRRNKKSAVATPGIS